MSPRHHGHPARAVRAGPWWEARQSILERFVWQDLEATEDQWLLKTDLFDEASGPHHHAPSSSANVRWLGIDLDEEVARAAGEALAREGAEISVVVCDVRSLPLADESIGAVVSLSTLDHFEVVGDIRRALAELARVLRGEGELRLTLDNPANPEVALRFVLPRSLVASLRSDRFFIGATMGLGPLREAVRVAGFEVSRSGYLIHAPRYPLIRLAAWAARRGWGRIAWLLRGFILLCEKVGRLPTRRWTGHYVAVAGRKRQVGSSDS